MTWRSAAYRGLRISNDARAIRRGKVGKRVARRAAGKAAGRLLGRLFR